MSKRNTKVYWWIVLIVLIFGVGVGVLVWTDFSPNIKDRLLVTFKYKQYELPANTNELVGEESPKVDSKLGYVKPGVRAILPGARWVPQTFNNCGPATVSMVLQYFGHSVGQEVTKAALRTNSTDSNVFMYEISDYLDREYGIGSKLIHSGTTEILKTLLANGFYVVVEDWLHPNEDIGHTTIIRGFDDEKRVFISDDSYIGANITYKYEEFEQGQWKPFNYIYLPVYEKSKENIVKAIIGEDWDEKKMYESGVKRNGEDVKKNPKDMYAWFNLGVNYYGLGKYNEAKIAFEKSRAIGWPRRMLWYQYQPIQVYNELGEYQKALDLAAIGLSANDSFAELHLESAIAYKGLGNLDKAREEVNKAILYAPNLEAAKEFSKTL